MRICSAESCIGSLTRSIMLKDGVLSGIKERLQEAEKKMNEVSYAYNIVLDDKLGMKVTILHLGFSNH